MQTTPNEFTLADALAGALRRRLNERNLAGISAQIRRRADAERANRLRQALARCPSAFGSR